MVSHIIKCRGMISHDMKSLPGKAAVCNMSDADGLLGIAGSPAWLHELVAWGHVDDSLHLHCYNDLVQ